MFKTGKIIGIAVFLIFVLFSLSFADESMTITTYYPSPYGSYNQLQTKSLGVGDNNVDGNFTSADVPTTTGDVWIAGKVGIGTTAPAAKLHVAGDIKADTVPFVFAKGTTDVTVGTAEADMPEMSISVTTDGSPVLLGFWAGYRSETNSHQTEFIIYRDATNIRDTYHYPPGTFGATSEVSIIWVDQPSAGTYTYKVRWRAFMNTSIRNAATLSIHGSILTAEVMKR